MRKLFSLNISDIYFVIDKKLYYIKKDVYYIKFDFSLLALSNIVHLKNYTNLLPRKNLYLINRESQTHILTLTKF